jgi:poly-gamma-glutamate synthesis protein (capsule biosynthesis protein)
VAVKGKEKKEMESRHSVGKKHIGRGKGYLTLLAAIMMLTACGNIILPDTWPEETISPVGQGEAADKEYGTDSMDGEIQREQVPNGSGTKQSGEALNPSDAVQSGEENGSEMEPSTEALSPEIKLVMVGDILLHTPVAESGWNGESYDFSAVFAPLKEQIREADLALVNQEVILGGAALGISGYPAFNGPFELGDALADTGFDVVLHATNHVLDKGKNGLVNCLAFWREAHPEIAVLGIHDSEAGQEEIYVYEQEGIRIAILNYTYGTNGIPLPGDMPFGVDLLERDRIVSDLKRAGELADFVVVCPHWGTEYVLEATKEQKELAALFAVNGADLVLGTHPHVIEPVVWMGEDGCSMDTKDTPMTEGRTLVYYSLGNFVNWTSGTGAGVANRMVGGMAQVVIGLDEEGEAVIKSYDTVPLVCHVEKGFGGVTVYPLGDYTEELAARNEIAKQDDSFSLEYCRKLAEDVFGTIWK